MTILVASSYLHTFEVGTNDFIVSHGPLGIRHRLTAEFISLLKTFSVPLKIEDAVKQYPPDEPLLRRIQLLQFYNFLHSAELDEEALILERLQNRLAISKIVDANYKVFLPPDEVSGNTHPAFAKLGQKKVKLLILGGCLTQMLDEYFARHEKQFGLQFEIDYSWPTDQQIFDHIQADVVLFQPAIDILLEPFWDQYAFLTDDQRQERLASVILGMKITISKLLTMADNRLIIIQSFSTPTFAPLGRADFRSSIGFTNASSEINKAIKQLIANSPNALYLDEEKLFSWYGKFRMLDDHLVPYSHHGPFNMLSGIPFKGPSRSESFGVTDSYQTLDVLCREVINSYLLWSGRGKIKALVVDLDHTLWPGLAGEASNILAENFIQTYRYGVFGGLHQALKILKERGILLVTASKNDESIVMAFWENLSQLADTYGVSNFLKPSDFVLHKINWDLKSQNIFQISHELELDPASILFIDDNPVERAEVNFNIPEVRTMGEDLNLVRHLLLDDPCLQSVQITTESSTRTEKVKGQLKRESERSLHINESDFLRSLQIRLKIKHTPTEDEAVRIAELIQRSSQFKTTQNYYTVDEIRRPVNGKSFYTLYATDKFVEYGLVGVCVINNFEIETLVISCRVLGLKAAIPFLHTVLNSVKDGSQWKGKLIPTERNLPCRSVFLEAGFKFESENLYLLPSVDLLTNFDTSIYKTELS